MIIRQYMFVHHCLEILIKKCRLNPQVDVSSRARAIRSRLSDVKLCSEAHLICQAGFLTYRIQTSVSPSHMYHDWVMQWDIENRLSEHSDRIAQDLHLIPFSYQTCRYALDTAFFAHFYFISFCAYCQASASIFCALLCTLILKAMDRCWNSSATIYKCITCKFVYRHNRCRSKESSDFYHITYILSDCRKQSAGCCLLIYHTDSHLICDNS